MILQKMKWPEVKEEIARGTVVIVPVGSTEQHGPHLPIDTDIAITYYIAVKAAEIESAVVAPPVNYGYNEKDLTFPGTVSVKTETFICYLFDICESLSRTGFKKILLLNGHGWNTFLITTVSHMVNEKNDVLCAATSYWDLIDRKVIQEVRESEIPGGMSHACEFETSIQLYLDPAHVDMSRAVRELGFHKTEYTFHDLLERPPVELKTAFSKVTRSGVIGDPTLASREKGEKLIQSAIQRLAEFLHLFKTEIHY